MSSHESSENEFLKKLTEIVEANLTNPQFGVSMLAKEMGISRFMLHRKVNAISKITASQFINQVRLHKAKDILRHTNSTVSDVAFQTGFNSTSYFIKCFHDYYGYSPGEVGIRENDDSHTIPAYNNKKWLITTATVLFVAIAAVVLFVVVKPFSSDKKELEKTIIVLPFINDSSDEDNAYIINGIMESINNNLCAIKELTVKSRASAEKYRNIPKLAPEIAKELNVNYIITGSGQKIGDKIILTVNLTEAPTDKQLWSDVYERTDDVEGHWSIRNEVAKSVTEIIHAEITPEEKQRIEKRPTENNLAWNYYLKGLELLQTGLEDYYNFLGTAKLEDAVIQFEKSIEHDHEFAWAYAELARTYFYLDANNYESERIYIFINKIRENARNAMASDAQSSKSLVASGLYYYRIRDYKQAIDKMEKALEYNPNSVQALWTLSNITFESDMQKGLEYSLLAVKREILKGSMPNESYWYNGLSNRFRYAGFFEEAELYNNRALEADPNNINALVVKVHLIHDRTGNYEMSKKLLTEYISRYPQKTNVNRTMALTCYWMRDYKNALKYFNNLLDLTGKVNLWNYDDYGRIGLSYKKIGRNRESEEYIEKFKSLVPSDFYRAMPYFAHYHFIALFSINSEKDNALQQQKLFLNEDSFPYWIIRVLKDDPFFDDIRDFPEFKKTLTEMETKFWDDHKRIRASLEEKGLL